MPGHGAEQWLQTWIACVETKHRLKDILRIWARELLGHAGKLPQGVRVSGRAWLDASATLESLREELPLLDGRLAVTVHWPEPVQGTAAAASATTGRFARSKLQKLRISGRYTAADIKTGTNSSTYLDKLRRGEYRETMGLYSQKAYTAAMRQRPSCDEERQRCDLVVREREGNRARFRVRLSGPTSLVRNWRDTWMHLESAGLKKAQESRLPFPVFIPSKGRPLSANLNWEAPHVFGTVSRDGLRPVVCVVVEPSGEKAYRKAWPGLLLLTLPADGKGPAYARWVVQQFCTQAYEWQGTGKPPSKFVCPEQGKPFCRKLPMSERVWFRRSAPFVWIADDLLTMFYRLVPLHGNRYKREPERLKRRDAPEGEAMFSNAFLSIQQHAFIPRAAVAGFLRDDGTAVCKKMEWKKDELALYKVVLLNLPELRRLNAEYLPGVQKYEDICLNHEVMRNASAGGHTMKCQLFCFRASHTAGGGCAEQRAASVAESGHRSARTSLESLVDMARFNAMSEDRRNTEKEVLRWVHSKEQKSLDGDPESSAASVRKQGVRSRASNASYPALKRVRNQLGESDNESGDSGTSSDSSSDE